jgi:acyl-CoA thioesterase FadM
MLPTAAVLMETFRIVTWEASVRYKRELLLHDPVAIEIRIEELTKASVVLKFTYRNERSGVVAAEGFQRLVFTDQAGRIVPLPDEVRLRAIAYQYTCDAA